MAIVEEITEEDAIENLKNVSKDASDSSSAAAESPSSSSAAIENPPSSRGRYWDNQFDAWNIFSLILAVVIAMIVVHLASPADLKPQIWTVEELAKHNGSNKRQPLLLSILGKVFDVSEGQNHYGPGGGYHHFTGRDASRAFVSGNFTGNGLTDSLEGLTPLQVKSIYDWQIFFQKKYNYVGPLVGRFYDTLGKPTEEMKEVESMVRQAEVIIREQKEDEKRFPSCNSRWNPQEGGEVWCKVGYPRIVNKVSEGTYKGTTGTRCACFEDNGLRKEGLQIYKGCAARAQRCQTTPPEVGYS